MANNSVNFKVFLRDENTSEARRFVVDDASVVTNFIFMKEKLQMVFPKLRDVNFRITWKDADGDEITIDSDEDLITAFTEMSGSLKILYITILDRKQNQDTFQGGEGQFHGFRGRVICDVCETPVTGYRYKCMQCPDYDLCANCEFEGHHSEHMMLRTSRLEFPFARCTRKIMDHINKSIKKVNHMAYKEACRSGKYRGKYERMWDGRRRCQGEFDQQEQPQTSQQNETAESSSAPQEEQKPNACPMQDINLEHITPLIYPILDALNNTVNLAPTEPGNANNPSNNNNNNNYSAGANPQQPNFMDLIRNAINGFFEGAAHVQQQQQQQQQQNQQMPESSNAPTAAAATSSQATSGQQEVRNIPMEVEKEVDLTKSPSHSTDFNSRREPGWTIINNQSSESPRPTAPTQTDRESAKIAEGLKQLLDMGFSDELNLVALLKRFDGNVGEVVKYLFEQNI